MKFVAASAMAERWWVVGFQVRSREHQLARSVEVSVRAQKKGRLPIHPMGRTKRKVMSSSSSGCWGKTTPRVATEEAETKRW